MHNPILGTEACDQTTDTPFTSGGHWSGPVADQDIGSAAKPKFSHLVISYVATPWGLVLPPTGNPGSTPAGSMLRTGMHSSTTPTL